MSDALFWDTVFSTDATSAEGLSNFTTIVHSQLKISEAKGLCGDQAQSFIDLTDQVSDPGKRLSVLLEH